MRKLFKKQLTNNPNIDYLDGQKYVYAFVCGFKRLELERFNEKELATLGERFRVSKNIPAWFGRVPYLERIADDPLFLEAGIDHDNTDKERYAPADSK